MIQKVNLKEKGGDLDIRALAVLSSAIAHHTSTTDTAGAKIQTQRVEIDKYVIADGDVLRCLARRAVGRKEALQGGLCARGRLDVRLLQDVENGNASKVEIAVGNGKGWRGGGGGGR